MKSVNMQKNKGVKKKMKSVKMQKNKGVKKKMCKFRYFHEPLCQM